MNISTDDLVLFESGFVTINGTLIFSWIVMFIMVGTAILLRLQLNKNKNNYREEPTKLQNFFESLVEVIEQQVKTISTKQIDVVFPFIATLFMYILVSNLISLIPVLDSPTGSLSTTLALALSMFIFSIFVGIKDKGFYGYIKKYFKPVFLMLPLNIIGELSRIISLSMRLYGNIMSSGAVTFILTNISFLSIGFPIMIDLLGTISGIIQAYIFSILSMVAISSDD
ncbi:MAG: F0F1 ATP synthase subunit A [Rickettsiales bacterium]|nr:F0F1 ATP synthase subunit A [Rickettsiales bacterium]